LRNSGASFHLSRLTFLHRGSWAIPALAIVSRCPQPAFFGLTLVLTLLVLSPLFPKIVSAAAPVGFFSAMSFSAAKRAAQIATPGIAGIREEKNTALPAPYQAFSQVRLGS
jgi:hypothetical protein